EVTAIMHDVMDNVPSWLPEILPGFDTSWMDIPIIGELEVGINAKDALAAKNEPSELTGSDLLTFNVPSFGDLDARQDKVKEIFGSKELLEWNADREAIGFWLSEQRYVFK